MKKTSEKNDDFFKLLNKKIIRCNQIKTQKHFFKKAPLKKIMKKMFVFLFNFIYIFCVIFLYKNSHRERRGKYGQEKYHYFFTRRE